MPLPWHMFTGLTMNVLAFFLLNWFLKSFWSDGSTHVLGKKLKSSLNAFYILAKFLARLFFLANACIPG